MKKPKKMSLEQVSKIKELSSQGLSAYAVAKKLSIPQGVARYHITREKLAHSSTLIQDKISTVSDFTALSVLKQQLARLDSKRKLLQDIIDHDLL